MISLSMHGFILCGLSQKFSQICHPFTLSHSPSFVRAYRLFSVTTVVSSIIPSSILLPKPMELHSAFHVHILRNRMVKLNALFALLTTLLARFLFRLACRLISGLRLFTPPLCFIIGCLLRQSRIVFPSVLYLAWILHMLVLGSLDVFATPTPLPLRRTSFRLAPYRVCSLGIHPSTMAIDALIAPPKRLSSPVMSCSMSPPSPLPPLHPRHLPLLLCIPMNFCRILSSRCRRCRSPYPARHHPQRAPLQHRRHRHGHRLHGRRRQRPRHGTLPRLRRASSPLQRQPAASQPRQRRQRPRQWLHPLPLQASAPTLRPRHPPRLLPRPRRPSLLVLRPRLHHRRLDVCGARRHRHIIPCSLVPNEELCSPIRFLIFMLRDYLQYRRPIVVLSRTRTGTQPWLRSTVLSSPTTLGTSLIRLAMLTSLLASGSIVTS